MDERVRVFAWIAGSSGFFGVLGAGFGAVTGMIYWRGGRVAGTALAQRVGRAFEKVNGRSLTPSTLGGIVGAIDGFLFLAVIGVLLGAISAHGRVRGPGTAALALTVLLLIAGALFFGGLAYAATANGPRGVAALFFGAVAGGVPGFWLASFTGLLTGVVAGGAVGTVGLLILRRLGGTMGAPLPQTPLLEMQDESAGSDGIREDRPPEW